MSVKNNNEITKNKSKIGQKLSRKSLLIMLGGGTIAIIVIGVGVHYIYRTRDSNPITPIEIKKPGDKTKEVISDADASQKETPPKIIELEELETDDASHTLTTTENKKATKNNDFTVFFTRHEITDPNEKQFWKEKYLTPEAAEHVYTNAYSEIENINEDERDLINHAKNSDEVVWVITNTIPWERWFLDNKNIIKDPIKFKWQCISGLSVSEADIAWNKGWKDIIKYPIVDKIMTGTIEFASGDSFSGLDVLEVSLHQLNFAGEILEDIARKTDINSFSENSWDAKIEGLNDNELPKRARKIDIREAIRKKREELTEKVSEMSKRGQADEKIKTTEVSSSKNTKELKVNTERRKSEALKLDGWWSQSPVNPENWWKNNTDALKSPKKTTNTTTKKPDKVEGEAAPYKLDPKID